MARGKRKKADADDKIPCILEPELTDSAFRKNWARLIQKIYEVDPPHMFSLQWANESDLVHRGRAGDPKNPQVPPQAGWDAKRKPPPRANAPPPETLIFYDDSLSPPRAEHYLIDPDYSVETYL